MKKSTLLSFATAAAIVATSAGTYAAWDQTTATTAPAAVTFREPVAITTSALTKNEAESVTAYNEVPTYVANTTFTVSNVPDDATGANMDYTVALKDNNQPVGADAYTTEVVDSATQINGDHPVKVTVKPNDTEAGKALGGKTGLTVEVTGTLKTTNSAS